MSYWQSLWLFMVMLVGIIALPGMDMALIVAHTLRGGAQTGLATLAGVILGGVGHSLIGFAGVAALFAAAPKFFAVMLLVSATYMGWIGFSLLRGDVSEGAVESVRTRSPAAAFRQGVATCLLNPKAYLFILTVYPQFMRREYGPLWAQALVFGCLTVATQFGIYGSLALAAAKGRQRFMSTSAAQGVSRGLGVLFIALALWTSCRVFA